MSLLPRDEDLPEDVRATLASLPPLNVFRMMAAAPASFRPLLDLALSILVKAELPARDREIAVLRVAHVTGSKYEWTQHERLARNLGLGDREIEAIRSEEPVASLGEMATCCAASRTRRVATCASPTRPSSRSSRRSASARRAS